MHSGAIDDAIVVGGLVLTRARRTGVVVEVLGIIHGSVSGASGTTGWGKNPSDSRQYGLLLKFLSVLAPGSLHICGFGIHRCAPVHVHFRVFCLVLLRAAGLAVLGGGRVKIVSPCMTGVH